MLHHFGLYSKDRHVLDRPLWVSDLYECAKKYERHATSSGKPIYYSRFRVYESLKIADLEGVSLQKACERIGISSHTEWNHVLSGALTEMGYSGLVYCGREIHIARPISALTPVSSEDLV